MVSFLLYLHACSAVVGLGLNVICQVCICRYLKCSSLLRSIFTGFIFGLVGLAFIELYYLVRSTQFWYDSLCSILTNIITYAALGYGYFHFVNLGETARRIRLLRELYDSEAGLSMSELLARYSSREVLNRRMDRLTGTGQIVRRNSRLYIGKQTVLYMAKIIVLMKLLFLGKRSEFDKVAG